MVASYENLYTKYPENILKKVKILGNSRLLTTYGCRECMFVSKVGPGVRSVTLSLCGAISIVYGNRDGHCHEQ